MRTQVSVCMSIYNCEQFLREAIESVLNQTYADFEFIIVNDGSTDHSAEILADYQKRDSRIVVASHASCGIGRSLNRAMSISTGILIARMDGDDRALPSWLQKQIIFLAQWPECSVVSSYAYFINAAGKRVGLAGNIVNVERGLAEMNPSHFLEIVHPTVLMRKKDVLRVGGYRAVVAEDRDLWGRMVTAGMMIRCNPEPLIEYRLHSGSFTARRLSMSELYIREGVTLNVVRRMQGKDELSADEMEVWFRSRPFWQKFNQRRRLSSGDHLKIASRYFGDGRWLKFLCAIGIAVVVRPIYVLTRVICKLGVFGSRTAVEGRRAR